ncbi:MAG TPA: Fe2+-dependent dioxygenase [Oceanospirillales bacterium]|nr:Fe2+-dependent dioxygenase [Oceanospirillales bacterium]
MILAIKNVLHENQLKVIRTLLANADFVDGKLSAGSEAVKVKQNEELARQSPLHEQLNQMLMPALLQHPEYQAFAFPIKIATPFYARYIKGMSYGLHVDDPVMGPMNGRYRSDISTTIFLNDDYEGGELVIMDTFGERRIKPTAGDAIVYPSTSLHEVTEVESGERLVAVLWAQSMIKDPLKRDLVYELGLARNTLIKERADSSETGHVSNVYANLVRRWSDV